MVKRFEYLGYTLKGNNSEQDHIKKIKGKANGVLGRLWNIAERRFRNEWGLRLFETMVKGVIPHGAKNWGWKEWKKIEGIKIKYVRWSMKLNRTTPWHTIRKDTGIGKIATNVAGRAMKFEEKLSKAKEESLEKLCWEQACIDEEEKWNRKERQKPWNGKKSYWRA